MKRNVFLFLIAFNMLFPLYGASCENRQIQVDETTERDKELNSRIIAGTVGDGWNSLGTWAYDMDDINVITGLSTQIILCHIDSLENAFISPTYNLDFDYEITVEEIFMDVNNMLNVGDKITVRSVKGIITVNELKKLKSARVNGSLVKYIDGEYSDDEYVLLSSFESIPFEEGKTYIMYLTDQYLDRVKWYGETGYGFSYEYTDGILYHGINYEKMNITIDQLKEQISSDIMNRSLDYLK